MLHCADVWYCKELLYDMETVNGKWKCSTKPQSPLIVVLPVQQGIVQEPWHFMASGSSFPDGFMKYMRLESIVQDYVHCNKSVRRTCMCTEPYCSACMKLAVANKLALGNLFFVSCHYINYQPLHVNISSVSIQPVPTSLIQALNSANTCTAKNWFLIWLGKWKKRLNTAVWLSVRHF